MVRGGLTLAGPAGTGVRFTNPNRNRHLVDYLSSCRGGVPRSFSVTELGFTVTLLAAYDQPVTMSFRTVNGTAKSSDGNHVAKTGALIFATGETTKTIAIEVKGDNKREANETFYLDLFGNSGNSLFTKNRGIGTIVNDD